ncbi:hypothetical protein SMACR_05477 [Sordaria macrospora]|uniref:WGS project CABT00000000 data, contig 2.6 n=2 Tax=Sordaria macrospora TaxID=5147 RepID=F7VT18_SORMK|nr:uncharacterized protein SMAC_05477 [Sordaria macrospora k-hell]KAA8628096.1 hypothetical protein SMACR_05477 [Sordaria macrospora]WPJ57543.1 hypothetical protein SMAC4_05477 [Sordaria macrospora]CCC08836.1 unnamed protein product [Sordaria macrospora k-hell]
MPITDLLDEIDKAPRFRPLVDKVVEAPPPQAPMENRSRLPRVPMPGSASRTTYEMAKATSTSSLQSRGAAAGAGSSLKSPNKQAVASSRNNGGSPTQAPRAGSGPTRTPRTTSACADPLAKPDPNPGPSDRPSPTGTTTPSTSQPAARKQQTKKAANPFPPKKRIASTAKNSTAPSSSRAAAPSTKAQPKQPPKPVNEQVKTEHSPDDSDHDSLFSDTVLQSIEKPTKPAPARRQKGSQVKKIISQAKRDVTAKRQAQVKLQAEKAKRAEAARIAREAEDVRDLAARSLISPSLTPTIIAPIGEVKLTRGNPLSALLATSDADMEPLKHGDYPIIISDALLGKASKETVSGIRYNHKPALSSDIAPSQARLKRSAKDGSYNLGFDDNGDKYQYNGVRTAADSQYVLVFDPDRKAFVLHQVNSMFNMNITKTPTDTNAAKQYPPLDVKGTVLDKPAPKGKASTAASKNKEAPTKNAPAGRGRGKAAQNKQNPGTSKPASPPRAEAEGHTTKRRKPSPADSEDEDEDDDDGGLTIEYPDGPPPERFKPAGHKFASPPIALTRRFSEFAAAYNPDEEEDVNMDAEVDCRFNEDADGEGGGYEDDDEEDEDEDMVDALALPSPINKPTAMVRSTSYQENPLPPPERFSFDDGSDMEAEFENVEESAPTNNQANAADVIDDDDIAAMEAELAKEAESDVSEEE